MKWKTYSGTVAMNEEIKYRNLLPQPWLILATFLLSGCITMNVPDAFDNQAEEAVTHPYGKWVNVYTEEDFYHGELMAVEENRVVLRDRDEDLVHIDSQNVSQLKVRVVNTRAGWGVGYSILGTLSTASHGRLLIISAPFWIISSIIIDTQNTNRGYETWERDDDSDEDLDAMRKYARFPAGLPEKMEYE